MARNLGVSPSRCVYFADNLKKDFVAPNALGWLTVRVARPESVYCDAQCAEGGQPAHSIKSLEELDPLLQ
jgi:putative hydrolase of the HAD superfamily